MHVHCIEKTLLVVGFYFIPSFLAMWCPQISQQGSQRSLLAIGILHSKGRFYMVLKGPFLNGTWLPVDQLLLLEC